MDNIFMNSKNCKTFYPHGLLGKGSDKYVALSNFSIY